MTKRTTDRNKNALQIHANPGEDVEELFAQQATQGISAVAGVLTLYSNDTFADDIDLTSTCRELDRLATCTTKGDLAHVERLLSAQILALNSMFAGLAHRSKKNAVAGYMQASETYLRLALKAQSQCRQTAESLFEMKNPRPVAFVRQANISQGHQQINNGPRAGKIGGVPSKLLEQQHGQWMDPRAQGATSGAHPQLATVGTLDRPSVSQRQEGVKHEQLPRRQAPKDARAAARDSRRARKAGTVAHGVTDA